jgi:hypothetical protein
VSNETLQPVELLFGSEFPTEPAQERAALSARIAAAALSGGPEKEEAWFDSEAPTGVAAERPILPRPPRAPRL